MSFFLLTRAASTLTLTVKQELLSVKQGRAVLRESLVEVGVGKDRPWLRLIHWETPYERVWSRSPRTHHRLGVDMNAQMWASKTLRGFSRDSWIVS